VKLAYDARMTRGDGSSDPTLTPLDSDPTLTPEQLAGDTAAETEPNAPVARVRAAKSTLSDYNIGELLGEGGMGEVRLAHDAHIGRDVALKRMRHAEPSDDSVARFLREARIQARLDHPAIVPVHELGSDAEGRPYFTMKRIPSATLHDQLARADVPKARLLRAFVDVCLAIEFAHARGFVHRDIKPTNISLGDYGEVYVLDWGVARAITDHGPDVTGSTIPTFDGGTQVGALLGTPGYMAPEQARGESVSTAADVYALGCMLFEILAGEPLHPRGTHEALASTLAGTAESPAARRPERAIPPELDAACIAAVESDPAKRPTAREVGERVQAYLDGDRDLERRRQLAAVELEAARKELTMPDARAEAIRRAGRALALDPESSEAATFVVKLLVEPPRDLPPQLDDELETQRTDFYVRAARMASYGALGYFAFLPVLVLLGVREWGVMLSAYGLVVALFVLTTYQARKRRVWPLLIVILNAAQMIPMSTVFGPFVFLPTIACIFAMTTSFGSLKRPLAVFAICLASFLLPVALQWLGWIHRTWTIDDGRIVLSSTTVQLGNAATLPMLIGGNVAAIITAAVFAHTMARERDTAHRRLQIQAWHLRKLLPVETPRPQVAVSNAIHIRE
jgi:eukaryotic-like serine/threonine-protein kinase